MLQTWLELKGFLLGCPGLFCVWHSEARSSDKGPSQELGRRCGESCCWTGAV